MFIGKNKKLLGFDVIAISLALTICGQAYAQTQSKDKIPEVKWSKDLSYTLEENQYAPANSAFLTLLGLTFKDFGLTRIPTPEQLPRHHVDGIYVSQGWKQGIYVRLGVRPNRKEVMDHLLHLGDFWVFHGETISGTPYSIQFIGFKADTVQALVRETQVEALVRLDRKETITRILARAFEAITIRSAMAGSSHGAYNPCLISGWADDIERAETRTDDLIAHLWGANSGFFQSCAAGTTQGVVSIPFAAAHFPTWLAGRYQTAAHENRVLSQVDQDFGSVIKFMFGWVDIGLNNDIYIKCAREKDTPACVARYDREQAAAGAANENMIRTLMGIFGNHVKMQVAEAAYNSFIHRNQGKLLKSTASMCKIVATVVAMIFSLTHPELIAFLSPGAAARAVTSRIMSRIGKVLGKDADASAMSELGDVLGDLQETLKSLAEEIERTHDAADLVSAPPNES